MENEFNKEMKDKYAALSDAISRVLQESGILTYMIAFHTPEGPTIIGLYGNPIFLSMLHMQLGADILSAMKEMFGIPKGNEEQLDINMKDAIDKKKMN